MHSELQTQMMGDRLIGHDPGLRDLLFAERIAQLFAESVICAQQLFLITPVFLVVKGILRGIEQQHIGFRQCDLYRMPKCIIIEFLLCGRVFSRFCPARRQLDQQAVVGIKRIPQHRAAFFVGNMQRRDFTGRRVHSAHFPLPADAQDDVLARANVGIFRFFAVAQEHIAGIALRTNLMQQIRRAHPLVVTDVHKAHAVQRGKDRPLGKGDALRALRQLFDAAARLRVHQLRNSPGENQPAARRNKTLQPVHGGGAQGLAVGNKHHIVGHLTHGKRRIPRFALLR